MKYALFGAISALLNKETEAELLIPWKLILLIQAVKSIDSKVIGVKILEHWQQLKVHCMPLEGYFREEKMSYLKRDGIGNRNSAQHNTTLA